MRRQGYEGNLQHTYSDAAGGRYVAEVGIIETYDNKWDAELDVWHRRVENTRAQELFQYKVLFYPHAIISCDREVTLLKAYVEQGGILVFGCRAGMKDWTGKCEMRESERCCRLQE